MKALLSIRVGGPRTLQLTDLPSPTPGPGQALVQVQACGVNFPDALIIEDRYQIKLARPFAPGAELAGIVLAVAPDVTAVKPGDRVIASHIWGAMAEEIAVDVARLTIIPDEMPFDEAAAFILAYGTSYYALQQRGHLRAGDRLLVLGAAGGVGLAAVQLGRAMGAHVVAAASTQDKVELCLQHGADDGVVYGEESAGPDAPKALAARFKRAAGGRGFDLIHDAVGGIYSEAALRSIAWAGRHLVIGFAAGEIAKIPLNLALLKGCDIVGVWWGAWVERAPDENHRNNLQLFELYRQGKIRPYISARFPLERGAAALEHLTSRQALGKVIVTMQP